MKRRRFFSSSAAAVDALATACKGPSASVPPSTSPQSAPQLPNAPGLTRHVSDFIVGTKYEDIPQQVLELGRKSILDGFGLALAGSVSEMGPLVRRYLQTLVTAEGKASIIGSSMKLPVRFAAFANGIFIHAD